MNDDKVVYETKVIIDNREYEMEWILKAKEEKKEKKVSTLVIWTCKKYAYKM